MTPTRFAAALSEHPVASHAVGEVAGEIMERFGGDEPDLVVCFVSPHFVGAMDDLAFALGNLLEPRVMLGATTVAVVGGPREVEDGPALSAFAASLPDARLTPVAFGVEHTPDGAAITGWPDLDDLPSTLLPPRRPVQLPGRRLPPPAERRRGRRSHRSRPGDRWRGLGGARPRWQPPRPRRPA